MHGPGESLRRKREARGRSIEELAAATGIRPDLLTALEQEAFDSLPGRGFGKLYIRAYAEVLGFDPRPVIEAYDEAVRGRQDAEPSPASAGAPRPRNAVLARWRQELMAGRADADRSVEPGEEPGEEPVEEVAALPLPGQAVSPSRRARSRWWLPAAVLLIVLLPLVVWRLFLRLPSAGPSAAPSAAPSEAPAAAPSIAPRPEAVAVEAPAPPSSPPVLPQAAEAPSLKVAESGVGLRLVGTRLEGEGDRFQSGQRVTFATRVLGGKDGESIRHVWLRDGRVEQTIGLRLGGVSWRTHSTKTLGRSGAWVVEARDEQGRVLARADITVLP